MSVHSSFISFPLNSKVDSGQCIPVASPIASLTKPHARIAVDGIDMNGFEMAFFRFVRSFVSYTI